MNPEPREPIHDQAESVESIRIDAEFEIRPHIHPPAGVPMDEQTLHARLAHISAHLERLAAARGTLHEPAWLRRTTEEPRLPVILAVLVAIGLQAAVPHNLAFNPWWLLPAIELLLLAVLVFFRQTKMDRQSSVLRGLGISLVTAAILATAWSATLLCYHLLNPNKTNETALGNAGLLLRNGGAIWLTNMLVFALLYWETDRGGPVARACGTKAYPDFLFSQMTAPELVHKDWEPGFADYLYLSFTNATAFSPTDTLPLSRWAKMTMMIQSALSLVTVALVVARAVNVLQ